MPAPARAVPRPVEHAAPPAPAVSVPRDPRQAKRPEPVAAAPPIAPAKSKVPVKELEEEELQTSYYQPDGKKVEDDEEDVRTKYYQAGDHAPKRLPTFEDLAAEELNAATARAAALPPLTPPPARPVLSSSTSVSQTDSLGQFSSHQPSVQLPSSPTPLPSALQRPSAAVPQFQPSVSPRDATRPAMMLPADAPRFDVQTKGPRIPWGKLVVMAVVGALVGLFVVLALAFMLRLTGR
jgi:hypothetical protein